LLEEDLAPGTEVILTDGRKKKIAVELRTDVRPARTAHRPIDEMLYNEKEENHERVE